MVSRSLFCLFVFLFFDLVLVNLGKVVERFLNPVEIQLGFLCFISH